MEIRPIAHIRTAFAEKFGVPRQSGLAKHLRGKIIFEKEFRNPDALRGLEGFSHLWLIWEFSANRKANVQSITVRPPRLGGNILFRSAALKYHAFHSFSRFVSLWQRR